MKTRFHGKLLHRLQLREAWVFFFFLGITLVNFPFLEIFNKPLTICGFPLLFLYLFTGWVVSIGIIFLFTLAGNGTSDEHTEKHKP